MLDPTLATALEILRAIDERLVAMDHPTEAARMTYCISPAELWLSTGATFQNHNLGEVSFSLMTSASSLVMTIASGTSQADIIDYVNSLGLGIQASQEPIDTSRMRLRAAGTSSAFVCVEQLDSLNVPRIYDAWDGGAPQTSLCDEGELTEQISPADLDCDGKVGPTDLAILAEAWGSRKSAADLDGSATVDAPDLAILLGAWTS